ncbi:O13/O129/O135 family O-antigen flippase [soil metagenome]
MVASLNAPTAVPRAPSVRRNTLWNLLGLGLPLVAGAALIPYLLRSMGVEAFGVLTLIWAAVGYFSLFDFGLGRALTQQVARSLARGDRAAVPGLVRSGLLLTTGAGMLGAVVLSLCASLLATRVLNVSEAMHADVQGALLLAAIGVPLTTATVGLRGVLEAYEDFRDVNLLRMMLGIANFALPALAVWCFGPSLVPMVAALTVARLISCIAHWRLVCRQLGAEVDLWRRGSEPAQMHLLLSFGAWLTVSSIIGPLMVTADRFVISTVLGAAVVAYYAVPSELMARVLILPSALTGALFPRFASLLADDMPTARALYLRCVAWVAAVLLPVCIAAAFASHWGLARWLGVEFADRSAPIAAILAMGLLLNGVAFVPFAAIQAAGLARITAQLHLCEAVFYFPLLLYGLHAFGLPGAAMAWTVRVGIDLALLAWLSQRMVFRDDVAPRMRHNFPSTEPQRTETP